MYPTPKAPNTTGSNVSQLMDISGLTDRWCGLIISFLCRGRGHVAMKGTATSRGWQHQRSPRRKGSQAWEGVHQQAAHVPGRPLRTGLLKMLSAVLGSKFAFLPRHLENRKECGIYSNTVDLSPRSKDKVGGIDQKTMMKNGQASTRPSSFSPRETALPSSLISNPFSPPSPAPRPWDTTRSSGATFFETQHRPEPGKGQAVTGKGGRAGPRGRGRQADPDWGD